MDWNYTPYILPSLAAAAVSAWLARYAWQRRRSTGSVSFTVLMLAVAVWSLAYVLELGVIALPGKTFWAQVQYVGIVTTPVAWLTFSLEYTGRERLLTRRRLILFSLVPLVTLLLAATNSAHHLVYRRLALDTGGPFVALDITYGAWFWVYVVYSYSLVLAGTVMLARAIRQSLLSLYRWQAVALLIGVLAPWLANALHLAGASPVPRLSLTPIGFTVSGLVLALGVLRFRLFDIIPVARQVVVDSMQDGMLVLDTHGRIVDVNAAGERILDRRSAEVIGQALDDVLVGLSGNKSLEGFQDLTESQQEIVLGQGETRRDYELQVSPLYDQRRQLRGRLLMLRDITERKQAEAELLAQKQLFQNLVAVARATSERPTLEATLQNALDVAVSLTEAEYGSLFLLDEAGIVTHSILSRGRTTWVQRQVIVGQVMDQGLAGWVARHRRPALIADAQEDDRWLILPVTPSETRSVLAIPILSGAGFLGLLTLEHSRPHHFTQEDFQLMQASADQMALALQNARIYDAISKERSRLRALIASSRDGIILVGMDQSILVINTPALSLLGLPGPPEDWVNRPAMEVVIGLEKHAPAAAELTRSEIQRLSREKAPPGEGEIDIASRTIRWLNLPVMAGERPLGRLWALRDVTEERLLEQTREDLTHTMVHDLRNPLNNIAGAQELLDDLGPLTPEQQALLEVAKDSTQQMLSLVNEILDISRLEGGWMSLECEPVCLDEPIGMVLRDQSPLAKQKDIALEHQAAANLPPAWADLGLIRRVLQNLIGNALKFTPAGGQVTVTAEVGSADESIGEGVAPLLVSVSDTGPGIPPELQERLFEKFTTGQQDGSGTGLGLAFCKMTVEAHGGRIWSENLPGRGATFKFTLPQPANKNGPERLVGAPANRELASQTAA